jgi:hypothetical protein
VSSHLYAVNSKSGIEFRTARVLILAFPSIVRPKKLVVRIPIMGRLAVDFLQFCNFRFEGLHSELQLHKCATHIIPYLLHLSDDFHVIHGSFPPSLFDLVLTGRRALSQTEKHAPIIYGHRCI